jgi:hypothetical protein
MYDRQAVAAWAQEIHNLEATYFTLTQDYHKNPTPKLRQTIIETGRCIKTTREAAWAVISVNTKET